MPINSVFHLKNTVNCEKKTPSLMKNSFSIHCRPTSCADKLCLFRDPQKYNGLLQKNCVFLIKKHSLPVDKQCSSSSSSSSFGYSPTIRLADQREPGYVTCACKFDDFSLWC